MMHKQEECCPFLAFLLCLSLLARFLIHWLQFSGDSFGGVVLISSFLRSITCILFFLLPL